MQLNVEITLALATSRKLVAEGRQLCKQVDAYRAVLAPIRCLPLEIIGEIFLFCVDIEPSWPEPSASLPLCQICSVWRDAALGHPALWKSIKLKFTPQNKVTRLEMMPTWLDRAKSLPLDIFITAIVGAFTISDVTYLIPYLPSTRRLRLCLPPEVLNFVLAMDVSSSSMPFLEELIFSVSGEIGSVPVILDSPSLFRITPRLHSLYILTDQNPMEIRNLGMLLPQIVRLSIQDVYLPDDVASLLYKELVNVEELSLRIKPWPGHSEAMTKSIFPIVVPKLRSLDLTLDQSHILSRFFQMVTLPLLDDLSMFCVESFPLDLAEFYRLQRRSSFNLISLALFFTEFEPNDFENLLRSTPLLVKLTICQSCSLGPENIRLLECSAEDTEPILPKLQDLKIDEDWDFTDGGAGISRMIASRWWPDPEHDPDSPRRISRLKSVEIYESEADITSPDAIEVMDRCIRQGLILSL